MHREPLLEILRRYEAVYPDETRWVGRVRDLVEGNADCFERGCLPGHITASAWILSPDRGRILLTHHRKLQRWLQLGGHADGDPDTLGVALREAREESGMRRFGVICSSGGSPGARPPLPLDVDVHRIPARGDEPEHDHHDIRYLLVAGEDQRLAISEESTDLDWFEPDALGSLGADESLLRLERKARGLAGAECCWDAPKPSPTR
ncbi:MAG: NUDIX hydrolase [Myxococcota bacterium]|nr:NUDIX hydrolase [Myxococcota bacterium]